MPDTLGLTPSQTTGPYLSIGLLRELVPAALVDPGAPGAIRIRGLLKRVVTRLYFPDEPEANDADPVLSALPSSRRESLVAFPEDGGLRFDIHLQGPSETTFFAV